MEFLKYSPFNQHQLLIISFLMARETALTIFKKLINQITFIWGFGTFKKKKDGRILRSGNLFQAAR